MKDKTIVLPPLPGTGKGEHYSWTDMEDYARAAIEADRRRRGEPVAWLRSDELRKLGRPYSDAPLNTITDSMLLRAKGTPEAAAKYGHDVPVFAAPQPTEPVKCPICYEDEPHTGTCGSSDPKALCNRAADPVKVPGDDERAAQGLPPYNPRLPTDEEMKRLTENGRKAWGKDDTEPVTVPSDDEIVAGMVARGWRYMDAEEQADIVSFAHDLLARCGQPAQPSVPDTIYLGCARMGMAGASDEEVLSYVRVATQKAATPPADGPPPKEPL